MQPKRCVLSTAPDQTVKSDQTVDLGAKKLAVNRCAEAWMRPSAGIEYGGGALVPYGLPIVEMDALIGVKCIRCLDFCQV